MVRALHFLLPTLNELEILVEMVLTSLKQLDINKATGSDGIPVRLLKETADQPHCPDHVIQQIFAARHLYMRGSKPTWLVGVNLAE